MMPSSSSNNSTGNRERNNTGGSTGSWIESGGVRERTHTDGSVRSSTSKNDHETIPLNGSPRSSGRKKSSTAATSLSNGGGASTGTGTNTTNSRLTRRRKIVDWIQQQRLPPRNNNSTTTTTSDSSTGGIPLITGLDRVMFGTQSAAEAILIVGKQPPRYLWYMLSGSFCDIIQFSIDMMLHFVLNIQDASTCWAIGFFLSVFFRHTSHRYLVFGDYVGGYRASLMRMYAGYSVIIVLSTVFNLLMTRMASVSHYMAWIATLLWTGIANYFILKKLWSFGGTTAAPGMTVASKS
jgi:hypothetical protein